MEEISKEKVAKKRISGEAYDINKQTICCSYSAEIRNRIKGALRPGARTGHEV